MYVDNFHYICEMYEKINKNNSSQLNMHHEKN